MTAEALQALDWTDYRCACAHHRDGCTNRAGYVVSIHAVHRCNDAGLDPFGNRIEITRVSDIVRSVEKLGGRSCR